VNIAIGERFAWPGAYSARLLASMSPALSHGWPLGCAAGPPLRPDRSGLQRGRLLLIQPTPPHLPLAVGLAPRIPPETL